MLKDGWAIRIYFTQAELALLNARALAESRKKSEIIKSAALSYARYGPVRLLQKDLELIRHYKPETRLKIDADL